MKPHWFNWKRQTRVLESRLNGLLRKLQRWLFIYNGDLSSKRSCDSTVTKKTEFNASKWKFVTNTVQNERESEIKKNAGNRVLSCW